ncbi:MAG: lysylphosphatidylglycerol synthase domain-containing protein [Pyrinomonadaceae bacterium]
MESENYLYPDESAIEPQRPRKPVSKAWLATHAALFLVGLTLLIWLVYGHWPQIEQSIVHAGWGILLVIGLNLLRHCCRAFSMYMAVAPEHRNFNYRSALFARIGGEAVNFFTFLGPFVGDATKTVLLRRNTPITQSASAVILDNILYYITVVMMVLAGVAVLLAKFGSAGSAMNKVLFAIVVVFFLAFVVFVVSLLKKPEPFSHVIRFLERRGWAPGFVVKHTDAIRDVEKNVFQFYHDRRSDFFLIFFTSVVVHMLSVLEVYFVLGFIGEEPNVANAFIIESLTKVINAVFGFIPGTIGVYEGGNGLIAKTLHLGASTGVLNATGQGISLALIRRAGILVGTAIGVVILIYRTAEGSAKRLKKQ